MCLPLPTDFADELQLMSLEATGENVRFIGGRIAWGGAERLRSAVFPPELFFHPVKLLLLISNSRTFQRYDRPRNHFLIL